MTADETRWKDEASEVLAQWEQVWEALGSPGRLGESKAAASLAAVKSWAYITVAARVADAARRELRADLRAELLDMRGEAANALDKAETPYEVLAAQVGMAVLGDVLGLLGEEEER